MRWLLGFCLLIFIYPAFSQEDPAALSLELTGSQKTDLQKVNAIFNWITENIAYNTVPRTKKWKPKYADEPEDTGALKPLNERVAESVLRKRFALCEGYARLFTTLCDYAGIRSVIIPGYARTRNPGATKFGVNHYWNAVWLDSSWHLLDVTWASGYISWQRNEFVRQYDGRYFLAAPEQFMTEHYPDDLQWTLLQEAPIPREFKHSPFKQKSFIKYNIKSYFPEKGIIDAAIGDTLRFELQTGDLFSDTDIVPDLLIDSTIFYRSPTWIFLQPHEEVNFGKVTYAYVVDSSTPEWLYLQYNDDIILRYKINVRAIPTSIN